MRVVSSKNSVGSAGGIGPQHRAVSLEIARGAGRGEPYISAAALGKPAKEHTMVKKIDSAAAKATKAGKKAATSAASTAKSAAANLMDGLKDGHLAGAVKDSAQQIWLAGMGAFSKAQAEGGKVFEALVKEGLSLQRKTQAVAEERINEVTGKVSEMAQTVTTKAGQNWDKLESIFEARTAKALNKLGVPTAKDVESLIKRVDELAAAVAKLSKGSAALSKKAAATKAPARKATARTTRRARAAA
jgi:poly(hydroxyalkanoate) granule-associated protein